MLRLSTAASIAAALLLASVTEAFAEAIELTFYRTRMGDDVAGEPTGVRVASYAVVRERRTLRVKPGRNRIRLDRVPEAIEAGSIRLASLTDPDGFRVSSVRAIGSLAGDRFVPAGPATVVLKSGARINGVIARQSDRRILVRRRGALELIDRDAVDRIVSGEPAVEVAVDADRAATHEIELVYRTGDVSWDIAYTAVREANAIDLSATLEIDNDTGLDLGSAAVRLVDRTAARAVKGQSYGLVPIHPVGERVEINAGKIAVPPGKSERPLLSLAGLAATTVLVYEPRPGVPPAPRFPQISCPRFALPPTAAQADVAIELRPPGDALARMVPGTYRVLDRVSPGELSPAAVGVLEIDRVARVARLKVGASREISSRRSAVSCQVDMRAQRLVETVELEVESHASEPVDVLVRARMMRWSTWVVSSEPEGGEAWTDGRQYRLALMPRASETLRYTVVYTW